MLPVTCPRCGTPTEAEARFCGVCGGKLEPVPTVPPVAPGPPDPAAPGLAAAPPVASAPSTPPRPSPLGPPSDPLSDRGLHLVTTKVDMGGAPSRPSPTRVPSPGQSPAVAAARLATPTRRPAVGPPPLESLVGRTLNGRFVVDKKIGEGGFGAVFRGRQVATGREVALKLLHPHNVSDTTVVARFRREAESCSKLSNQHTVMTLDFDQTEDGVLYLAMELVKGRPLQDVQKQEGPLADKRVLGILAQVAEALGEAHALGIIHRDMKPENVMVDSREGEDFVKVLDFGIAKIVAEDPGRPAQALTAVGQTLGTLEFMSPEQLRGQRLDGRSDIYALGIMAYEMLTGRLPWKTARGPTDIIQFHLQGIPPAPSSLRPDLKIPREVDEVVLKMVAKDRDARYADAADLRHHISKILGKLDRSLRMRDAFFVVAVVGVLAAAVTGAIFLLGR
jgi:tRNA A-37 threonylcarbamoyl transferase component Bud32